MRERAGGQGDCKRGEVYQSGGKTDCSEISNESNSVAYLSRGGGT